MPARPPRHLYGVPADEPHLSFHRVELLHLLVCVVVLTYAFAVVLASDQGMAWDFPGRLLVTPLQLLAAFVAVATGFVLHELAHKVVAQRYGHAAEFRAQFSGLLLTVLIAIATPFLVAAPGAVWISGRVTPRENGLISLVGPGMNLLLVAAALPFSSTVDPDAAFPAIMGTVAKVNAVLAVFNLVPIGALDGRKVIRWNVWAWALAMAASVGAFVAALMLFG